MFKVVALLKRRPDLTMEQFIAYYESSHSKLGEKYLRGKATRYVRRYFCPLPHPIEVAEGRDTGNSPPTGGSAEADHDVMMEMWFESREKWLAAMAPLADPAEAQAVVDDELRFMNREMVRMYVVDERESDIR